VHYIAPVPSSKGAIEAAAKTATSASRKTYLEQAAASPLVFPSTADLHRLHRYRELKTSQESKEWTNLFQPIYQS
jgi:spermidine/putrescine transport system substrate-binding protein